MEVFIRDIRPETKIAQLEQCLGPKLEAAGAHIFDFQRLTNKACAIICIRDATAASIFLARHGVACTSSRHSVAKIPLICHGSCLKISKSRNQIDKSTLKVLDKKHHDNRYKVTDPVTKSNRLEDHQFAANHLQCGLLEHQKPGLSFTPAYEEHRNALILFGRKNLAIVLSPDQTNQPRNSIVMQYNSLQSVITTVHDPQDCVTFSLSEAPSFYKLTPKPLTLPKNLSHFLQSLSLDDDINQIIPDNSTYDKYRLSNLNEYHAESAGQCFVYRLTLNDRDAIKRIRRILQSVPEQPPFCNWPIHSALPVPMRLHMNRLDNALAAIPQMPFETQFQLHRLAKNGILSPWLVVRLLPLILSLQTRFTAPAIVNSLQQLARNLPFPSPDNASEYMTSTIVQQVIDRASAFTFAGSRYQASKKYTHLAMIHTILVTPAGIYLKDQELEIKNRILRKYPDHESNFLRVTLADEDGERIHYERGTNRDAIWERFRSLLSVDVAIAGKRFAFLGLSHSSLRAGQCWFMAPFVFEQKLLIASMVIKDLGDFSRFRSPAKCMARIGQAFTDATDTISMMNTAVNPGHDIERNGRNFTDGSGTCSQKLLDLVHTQFSRTRKERASLLQIRFQGAKGMLSLDTRLRGNQIVLRPSMRKFEGSQSIMLEICGAGYRKLPMFVNRQLIKILEDLGSDTEYVLKLQAQALQSLEDMIENPINAAKFLDTNHYGGAARTPYLIRSLHYIGLNFREDEFLRHYIEVAASVRIRDLKHRARIPVENAHTLYGIPDETNYLKAGQIYVSLREKDGARRVICGRAIITRSPAMHPGDVQRVSAVDVPKGSPLEALHNCVVFSVQGERDLASQLSGGDLDGDLYNVIFDQNLFPSGTAVPADYPRVQGPLLDRIVETKDMTDFFVSFMENDNLGHIANTHLQVADQEDEGTFNEKCITLAGLASTAVDFAKTGIPVSILITVWDQADNLQAKLSDVPKFNSRAKPDFMAPAPHLVLGNMTLECLGDLSENGPDATSLLDPDPRQPRYYESDKILGKLYRNIDETKFLKSLRHHDEAQIAPGGGSQDTMFPEFWAYVQRESRAFEWEHHRAVALQIKNAYEGTLLDLMYQYSQSRYHPLSELEVFVGTMLGKDGSLPSRRTRDQSLGMKEEFERELKYYMDWIVFGDGEQDNQYDHSTFGSEALERSIACLAVAIESPKMQDTKGRRLKSFRYVAAVICLVELEKLNNGRLRPI